MTTTPATTPADGELHDDFRGDDAQLVSCIKALISMSDAGALVPHGIGGHARALLSAAAVRLSLATPSPGKAPSELIAEIEAEPGGKERIAAARERVRSLLASPGKAEAERDALLKDKARLDSGVIMTSERDEFGEEYTCERRGLDLRAMIDAAMQAQERDKQ